MKNFDFEKVHKVMKLLEWKWYCPEYEGLCVPDLDTIKSQARKLLQDVLNRQCSSISTGGFRAERFDDNSLRLSFVVADWDSD